MLKIILYIKYTEFVAACLDARDYTEEAAVHEAFHRLDVNRTGGITKEDMIELLKNQLVMEIQDKNVEDVVDEMFKAGDKDGTGEINISDLKAILNESDFVEDGEVIDWRTASNRGSSMDKGDAMPSDVSDIGILVNDSAE